MGYEFPSLRWPQFRRILTRKPLGYRVSRQSGSHRTLEANGRPTLHLSFHDNQELPGSMIRKILVTDVKLTENEARQLIAGRRQGNEE